MTTRLWLTALAALIACACWTQVVQPRLVQPAQQLSSQVDQGIAAIGR